MACASTCGMLALSLIACVGIQITLEPARRGKAPARTLDCPGNIAQRERPGALDPRRAPRHPCVCVCTRSPRAPASRPLPRTLAQRPRRERRPGAQGGVSRASPACAHFTKLSTGRNECGEISPAGLYPQPPTARLCKPPAGCQGRHQTEIIYSFKFNALQPWPAAFSGTAKLFTHSVN